MGKKTLIILVILMAVIYGNYLIIGFGINKPQLESRTAGDPVALCKISISGTGGPFKNNVVNGIIKKYKNDCYVKVNKLSGLKEVKRNDYNVLIIFDEVYADMKLNFIINNELEKIKNINKVILFLSTNPSEEFKFSYMGVDAITSATRIKGALGKEKEGVVLNKIINRIDKIVKTLK